ncbi:MAG: hypothetical protein ABL898_14175, partial [Hyphomicrobiaceae bacterium]
MLLPLTYRLTNLLGPTLAGVLALGALPALAEVGGGSRGVPPNSESMAAGGSTQGKNCHATSGPAAPFAFSIDGKPAQGRAHRSDADSQRCVDKALSRADIQVRYDGLEFEPRLNVVAGPDAALAGGPVVFATYSNYALQLARGEVRIFEKGSTTRQTPIAVLPLSGQSARWTVPKDIADEVTYVFRVYDENGRFDETSPKGLDIAKVRGGKLDSRELSAVYSGNALSVRNIAISGGAVLVSGRDVPAGHMVSVMGMPVPIDSKGDFAIRQVLPPGTHNVDVVISDKKGIVTSFARSATIPTHDFFYVGLAELTVGRGSTSGPADILKPATADEFKNEVYVNGRLAFYLKGKVNGDTLMTAAADTRDQPFRHLFSNFDSKDPRYLLRNLDPNRYYPVYGDDSTIVDDAPTRGKFYVRVERGDSNIVWGNFKTTVTGTEYVRYERGLYGARAQTKTEAATKFGERRGQVEVFAAEPGTLGARDVFRGTGGSLYYLRRQNITTGSERVTVESRDRVTGLVLKTRTLSPTQDYDINYLQGRVVLKTPLASTGSSEFVVLSGALSGSEQFVVVNYEYAPELSANRDRAVGGRGSYWVNDHVQVGVTGYDQNSPGEKLAIGGADVTLRATAGTYVKFEAARSSGPGSGENVSIDGGFTFDTRQTAGAPAWAKRVEAAADLSEIFRGAEGRIAAYWKDKDRDYSGPGELAVARASREMGIISAMKISERWSGKTKLDDKRDEFRNYTAGEQNLSYRFDDYWKGTIGARLDDNRVSALSASPVLNQRGRRADVAAKLEYDSGADWSRYLIGQVTVDRTGERDAANRVGVGATQRLDEKTKLLGEVSTGSGGLGGKAGVEYKIDEKRISYLNYAYDPDRTDIISRGGAGVFAAGSRHRFTDSFSVFGEERAKHGGGFSGLTHAFGLDFVPYEHWKSGLAFETGRISDPYAGDVKRTAISGMLGYSHEGLVYTGKYEFRHDAITRGVQESVRDTYLMTNALGIKIDKDWRFVGKLNGSYSTSSQGDFYRGDYLEGVVGYAYRPVNNDRLNALFKYTYFYDLPSPGQRIGVAGVGDYSQRSHVLSADAAYDVTKWVTLGAKYAFRIGEVRDNKLGGPWFDSKAQLLIGRADWHVVKQWDL